jgi:predicted MFS family arabinose efflux permease
MADARQPQEPLSRATILGLGAMALAVLVIANDFTALSVALPAIEADLDTDVTTVQWIITGYALVFTKSTLAALLVTAWITIIVRHIVVKCSYL